MANNRFKKRSRHLTEQIVELRGRISDLSNLREQLHDKLDAKHYERLVVEREMLKAVFNKEK